MQVRCFKFCPSCTQEVLDNTYELTMPISISETTPEAYDNQENLIVEAYDSPERLMELEGDHE